jgi:hypothetical protein
MRKGCGYTLGLDLLRKNKGRESDMNIQYIYTTNMCVLDEGHGTIISKEYHLFCC